MSASQGLIDVRANHRFDEHALQQYLRENLAGFSGDVRIQQFEAGQSNPTFLLNTQDSAFVLRKKPPGQLLPSAHQIEREYRIYRALAGTDVPVPRTHLLCDDESIIGTPFYVMDYLQGRVFADAGLPGINPNERAAISDEMIRILAALHLLDYKALGLADFGKPGNYFARQIGRWTKQYVAAATHDIPSMNRLMDWLPENTPNDETTTIVHGDFQLYNLMYHPTNPTVLAVLDWELATLGHPLADLAYNCMKYHSAVPGQNVAPGDGIPDEAEVIAEYCQYTGRSGIEHWNFYLAFSFFRLASIVQGVYKRGLQGNASSARAMQMKDAVHVMSDKGWELASNTV